LLLYLFVKTKGMLPEILWILFLIALLVQLIYILVIFGRLSFFYKNKIGDKLQYSPEGVTVIIAAHNERANLKNLIPLICEQDYPNFDIMVINDRSTDGTKALLERMMTIYPKLRTVTVDYTPDHVTPKKYALTLGIKVAQHDVLLLTDVDCIPQSKNWINLMTRPIREENKAFSLGFSQYKGDKSLFHKWIQFETLWTAIQYMAFAIWKAPFMGVGRNLSYRKSFFLEKKAFKGLWHIDCGDDDLFVNRYANGKNTAVVIDPESVTFTNHGKTWKSYFNLKKKHFHAGKYYKASDKPKVGLYVFSHLVFWICSISLLVFSGILQNWEHFGLILGIILVRFILIQKIVTSARKKLEGSKRVFWTGFFDIMYLGYFWIIGTLGYQSKRVRWK
jgi:glycosyltransferase involved in cell wall biosynthesis